MRILTILIAFCFFGKLYAQPCNMQGTYKIGPAGDYTTIASALNTLRTNGLGGPVILEIKTNYTNITEALLNFGNIPCVSAANTITLRPETGAANIRMSSNGTIIILGNANNIIIDGRPGGTGAVSQLTMDGVSANNCTVLFSAGATNNIIQYVKITSTTTVNNLGTVTFQGGCSNNIVRNCTITGNGNGNPMICVYGESTTTKNTNNKIEACNITRFTSPSSNSGLGMGIYLGKNNEGWQIKDNSLYADFPLIPPTLPPLWNLGGDTYAICINDTTSYNSITGNFIGGSAPQCGGQSMVNNVFRAIVIAAGKQISSSIQGNTIQNIWWNSINNPATGGVEAFTGIHIMSGRVNCGTITPNIIGSLTQNESIRSTTNHSSNPQLTAILAGYNLFGTATLDTVTIRNNKIGGISCKPATGATNGTILRAIHIAEQKEGMVDITNNIIGSQALNDNMYSEFMSGSEVIGIDLRVVPNGPTWLDSPPIDNFITGNRISHCTGIVTGMRIMGGKPQVLNNSVQDINMSNTGPNSASVTCLDILQSVPGSTIKGNHFFNITLNVPQASGIIGISLDNTRGMEISNNFMHNFQVKPISLTGIVTGILSDYFVNRVNVFNNMMSFGADSSGSPHYGKVEYTGIKMIIDTSNIMHNSIYITGVCDRDAAGLLLTKQNNSVCRVTNNIIDVVKAQLTTNNFTYNWGTRFDPLFTSTLNGLVMNNNLYNISGLGSFLGSYNNANHSALASWQTATGNESNSLTGDPNFIAAASDSLNTNMHIKLPTQADANGVLETTVIGDYDVEQRSALTPVDIGADAISSTPSATIISFTPVSGGTGTIVTITGTNLTGTTAVSFGGTAAASFTVVNATTITAVVANGATGSVSVTRPGGTAALPGFTFIPFTITSFTPTSGITGTTVTITGTNFTGVTAVSFGGTAAASFTLVNATTITAIVANGATGSVSVTTVAGTASLAGFTFFPVPTITSFTPTSGATGATITISGTGFNGATTVSFGGTAATSFTVVDSVTITAVVANGATGSVNVTTPGGTASLAGFTYIAAPTITSFTPTSAAAGTTITITGTNFNGTTDC